MSDNDILSMSREEYGSLMERKYIAKRGGSVPAHVAFNVRFAAEKRHDTLSARVSS